MLLAQEEPFPSVAPDIAASVLDCNKDETNQILKQHKNGNVTNCGPWKIVWISILINDKSNSRVSTIISLETSPRINRTQIEQQCDRPTTFNIPIKKKISA